MTPLRPQRRRFDKPESISQMLAEARVIARAEHPVFSVVRQRRTEAVQRTIPESMLIRSAPNE